MGDHGVTYPVEFGTMPMRDALHHSQTNVTHDPRVGLQYAAAAYDIATLFPDLNDPTAAGEAAAKAGLLTTFTGSAQTPIRAWFDRSYEALHGNDTRTRRELVDTYLLEGRSWAYFVLVRRLSADGSHSQRASHCFEKGQTILDEQHQKGERWDPYATMLSRHWAAHEAMNDSAVFAAKVASRGVWQAIRAKQETANSPAGLLKHSKFVVKQVVTNAAAGALAITKPLNRLSPVAKARRKVALSLLG